MNKRQIGTWMTVGLVLVVVVVAAVIILVGSRDGSGMQGGSGGPKESSTPGLREMPAEVLTGSLIGEQHNDPAPAWGREDPKR